MRKDETKFVFKFPCPACQHLNKMSAWAERIEPKEEDDISIQMVYTFTMQGTNCKKCGVRFGINCSTVDRIPVITLWYLPYTREA